MQIDGFIDKDEFKGSNRRMEAAPGTHGPLIPGDPELDAEAIQIKDGIPLLKPLVDDLHDDRDIV